MGTLRVSCACTRDVQLGDVTFESNGNNTVIMLFDIQLAFAQELITSSHSFCTYAVQFSQGQSFCVSRDLLVNLIFLLLLLCFCCIFPLFIWH